MNILIFGSSFSGSTVLSGMLGAHSRIVTLGEIEQWFLWNRGSRPDEETFFRREQLGPGFTKELAYCRKCGPDCESWGSFSGTDDPTNLYSKLRAHFGSEHIVDSSKHPNWFEQIIPMCPDDEYRIVLLHKTIWAQLTSKARYSGLPTSADLSPQDAWDSMVFWCYFYRGFRDIIDRFHLHGCVVNVRYEDLVLRTASVLSKIIEPMGLRYEPAMDFGFNRPHHEIAGNTKLKLKVRRYGGEMPLRLDPLLEEAPPSVREACLAHADAKELMEWLGR